MLKGVRCTRGVHNLDKHEAAPVMGLLRGDGNGLRAPGGDKRLKRLLGILPGKHVDTRHVFLALQFVQSAAQRLVSPPRP